MSRRRLPTSRSQVGTEDKPRTFAVESAPSATVGKGPRIAALLLRFGAVFAPIVGVVVAIFLGGAIAGPTGRSRPSWNYGSGREAGLASRRQGTPAYAARRRPLAHEPAKPSA